jgi:TolA-binding protein
MATATTATRTRRAAAPAPAGTAASQIVDVQPQAVSAEIQQLRQQVAQLQEQLETRDELSQILWVNDRQRSIGRTKNGKSFVRFSAQKSTKLDNGTRAYGAYKNFVAYGDMCAEVNRVFEGEERLVRINGFESPWLDNSKRSDYVVTSIEVIARQEDPQGAVQPALPYAGGPTDEKVPF